MTLREYMATFREDHRLSQRQFAQLSGLSSGYISMIENNLNPTTGKPPVLSLSTIKKLASAMGLSVQALTDIIESENVSSIDEAVLSEDERDLIMFYRELAIEEKHLLLSVAKAIIK